MKMAIEILGYGMAVPAAIAFAVVWIGRRFGSNEAVGRTIGVAAAAGFCVGSVLMLGWDAGWPARHWQWLPSATVLAGAVGVASGKKIHATSWWWALLAAVAIVAAWLIVPTRPTLWPPRLISMALLAAYLFGIMALLSLLPERLLGRLFLAQLALTTGAVAVLLAAEISMTFGQLGIVAAAALGGTWAATRFASAPLFARAVIPAFVVMAGGLAYVGCIGRDPPLLALPVVAAAPLALWICATGPLTRLRGGAAGVVQTAVVLMPIVIAILWTLMGSEYEH